MKLTIQNPNKINGIWQSKNRTYIIRDVIEERGQYLLHAQSYTTKAANGSNILSDLKDVTVIIERESTERGMYSIRLLQQGGNGCVIQRPVMRITPKEIREQVSYLI